MPTVSTPFAYLVIHRPYRDEPPRTVALSESDFLAMEPMKVPLRRGDLEWLPVGITTDELLGREEIFPGREFDDALLAGRVLEINLL